MRKLPVILFCVMIFSALNVRAANIFTDDFETGNLSNWSGVVLSPGSTIYTQTALPRAGTHGLRFDSSPILSTQTYAYAYRSITPSSLVYTRFYFFMPQNFYTTFQPDINAERKIFRIYGNGAGGRFIEAMLSKRSTGSGGVILSVQVNTTWTRSDYLNLVDNTWYCVEILAPAAAGTARVRWWVNGTEQTRVTANLSNAGS